MNTISIRVKGDKELQMYFVRLERKTPEEGDILTEELAKEMVAYAKEKVSPLNSGSGALRRSIKAYPIKRGQWVVSAGEGLKDAHAYYQEYGFTPHWIHRTQFGIKARKNFIFVSQFFPYMAPARRKILSGIDTKMNRVAEKIIRG